jgi:hypothetical protein
VPQYFFIIRTSDAETEDDPHGTNLHDLGAALSYAERTIREMQKGGKYKPPGPMMIVMDKARQVVLTLPFSPACA